MLLETYMQFPKIQDFKFFHHLAALPFIDHIFLFGFSARGDNTERVDIDLAVDCPKATQRDWSQVLDVIENADMLLKIDCVRFDELDLNHPLRQSRAQDKVFNREETL